MNDNMINSEFSTVVTKSKPHRLTGKLALNRRRNLAQDQAENLEASANRFVYSEQASMLWNPESYSLLYGTPLWDEASPTARLVLNHLYWVAYYSQIISAEIATIYYNQTAAAALFGKADFHVVCQTLDLESAQERGHIAAFRRVCEATEDALFGERMFTYPMRSPFAETMIFPDSGPFRKRWKAVQLGTFGLLSSGNAFIGCQYFTIRGLRTLNGKIIQEQLGKLFQNAPDKESAPIPAAISYYHFLDESFHFNSSRLISHDVVKMLPPPTPFERYVINTAIQGCQRDHKGFSTAINGIFWHDPSLMPTIYKLLRSPVFEMTHRDSLQMMTRCFAQENEGMHLAMATHNTSRHSYMRYLEGLDFVDDVNRTMSLMGKSSLGKHLDLNRKALSKFVHCRKLGRKWHH